MNDAYFREKEEVLGEIESTPNGLSRDQADARALKYGANVLEEGKKKSLGRKIFEQIRDPMILVLIAAAVVSGLFQEIADMCIILVVVILNAILGIVQENKAEHAIEALKAMSAPRSRVRRDGRVKEVPSAELVPGDIVLLEAGDAVPADLRILEAASLKTEEAALTGESLPVEKQTQAIADQSGKVPLGDRTNMAYMGTSVVYGRGEGIVVATGMNTEMGNIAHMLSVPDADKTPLQKKLAALSKILSLTVLGICAFIFMFSVLTNGGFGGGYVFEAFLTAVSLAVAAIPEGLVVVVTVLLSLGVTKMSKRHAIIRKLTAVETLGCTQVICSDKTGTLTQNKMTIVEHMGEMPLLAEAMALCSDVQEDEHGNLLGDPTETALVDFANKNGLKGIKEANPRLGEAPFDSVRKRMTTLHKKESALVQYTKGAPDEVLKHCTGMLKDGKVIPLDDYMRQQILDENRRMAGKALRVLAAATRVHDRQPEDMSPPSLEQDLTFIGLVGMIDPIRPEVKAAVEQCTEAGIRTVMITGDHKATAAAIAHDLGILQNEGQSLSGTELSALSDEAFEGSIDDIVVYARVQPEHKMRIINMWKKKGRITAMTGDGVNDAPALKSADIGVGMGITGTDVTKSVADMVLADDNFATIVYAVKEGRRIYENVRKAIQFLLASNLSEVIAIFIATISGFQLFSPIHILWINLVTDTFPAMALGMEQAEGDVMKKPPRDPNETIFAGGLGSGIVYQGVLIALLTLLSFFIGNAQSHITGMTMAFLTLSMCEIFHSFNMRSRNASIFHLQGHNKYLLGAMLLSFVLTLSVIYIPGVNTLFELTPLPLVNFIIATVIALAVIPIVELVKAVMRAIHKGRSKTAA